MTLSRRLLALFVLFCGPALLLLWLSASQWLGGSLERIRTMVEDGRVDQVYSHFGYFVADWQRWLEAWNRDSDALNYVRNPDPAYEQQRLREEMLQFNHIHLMLIFDARQQLVFQRCHGGERVIVAINASADPAVAHFDAGCGRAVDLITGEPHDFGGGSELAPFSAYCSRWWMSA